MGVQLGLNPPLNSSQSREHPLAPPVPWRTRKCWRLGPIACITSRILRGWLVCIGLVRLVRLWLDGLVTEALVHPDLGHSLPGVQGNSSDKAFTGIRAGGPEVPP